MCLAFIFVSHQLEKSLKTGRRTDQSRDVLRKRVAPKLHPSAFSSDQGRRQRYLNSFSRFLLKQLLVLVLTYITCPSHISLTRSLTSKSNLIFIMGGPGLNDKFPNLVGSTQLSDTFDLYEYLGDDSWGLVFMHPADYTPVCTTEMGRAANLADEFAKRNIKLCGFSCNDGESHTGWIEDIKCATGGQVTFPLFCDPTRKNAVKLGILDSSNQDAKGLPLTVRSVYILKPDKTVALTMGYPATVGRNFDEILRVIDSLQLTVSKATATPADWKRGEDVIVNFPLTDAMADEKFGKDGYRIVELPSEKGKDIPKHYLRYTKDPSST